MSMSVTDGLHRMAAEPTRPRPVRSAAAALAWVSGRVAAVTDRYVEAVVVILCAGSIGLGLTFALAPEAFSGSTGFGMLFYGPPHPSWWSGIAPQVFGAAMAITALLFAVLALVKSPQAAWPALGLTLAYLAIPIAFLSAGGTPSATWVYSVIGLLVGLTGLKCAGYRP